MIQERYATAPRIARPAARRPVARQWTNVSNRVSPWRLYHALGDSPMVQIVLAMALLAVACLLYLTQASHVSVIQYNIADLQSQRVQLTADNTALEERATSLQAIGRIQHIAITQLHMVTPDIRSVLWVSPTFPRIPTPKLFHEDTMTAERQSQPVYWLRSFARFVKSSL